MPFLKALKHDLNLVKQVFLLLSKVCSVAKKIKNSGRKINLRNRSSSKKANKEVNGTETVEICFGFSGNFICHETEKRF